MVLAPGLTTQRVKKPPRPDTSLAPSELEALEEHLLASAELVGVS